MHVVSSVCVIVVVPYVEACGFSSVIVLCRGPLRADSVTHGD